MAQKDRVTYGFTTYTDIRDAKFGKGVYRALESISNRLTPNRMKFLGVNLREVEETSFSENWYKEYATERKEHRGKNAKVLEKGVLPVGCDWSRTGTLSAKGSLGLGPSKDPLRSYTLSIEFNYTPRIDWAGLFVALVDLLSPSYGMLHLFTKEERIGKPSDNFTFLGPVVGEREFTGWISSLGDFRRPDSFELDKRKNYVHLPQLSWMNFLGSEFNGQYDKNIVKGESNNFKEYESGILFSVTENIDAVKNQKAIFEGRRENLKQCFVENFFRF